MKKITGVSYHKMRVLQAEKCIKNKDLREKANLSTATYSKLNKDMVVTTDILIRICEVLECDIGDIVRFIFEEED